MPTEWKSADQEAKEVLWRLIKWGVPLILILLVLGWGLLGSGIISRNIQREVVQHSQQYTETKSRLLNSLVANYSALDVEIVESTDSEVIQAKRAQQRALLNQIKMEADLIPESQVPSTVQTFLSMHGG